MKMNLFCILVYISAANIASVPIESLEPDAIQFIKAAENGRIDTVNRLIQAGADVNARDTEALKRAVYRGHDDVVKSLLDAGADKNPEPSGILVWAVHGQRLSVLKFLLANDGIDVNQRFGTALRQAIELGKRKFVRVLMEHGARIDFDRYQVVRRAIERKDSNLLKELLVDSQDGTKYRTVDDPELAHEFLTMALNADKKCHQLMVTIMADMQPDTEAQSMPIAPPPRFSLRQRFERLRSSRYAVVGIVSLALFSEAMAYGLILPFINDLVIKMGRPSSDVGFLAAVFAIGSIVSAPVFGFISDRYRCHQALMIGGLGGLLGSTLLFAFATSFWQLAVSRAAQGIATSATWAVGFSMIAEQFFGDDLPTVRVYLI
jgi:hypothetical protein